MGEMHEMYGLHENGEYNPIDGEAEPVFRCFNCDATFAAEKPALFCSSQCREEAEVVRYVRACMADGRFDEPPVLEAIRIRVAHVLSGGYRSKRDPLPKAVRAAVFQRDRGICQSCGAPGTEVDHIKGRSNALDNLQLLCGACHNEKTLEHLVPIDQSTHAGLATAAHASELDRRFRSPAPERPSDDHETWSTSWRGYMAKIKEEWP